MNFIKLIKNYQLTLLINFQIIPFNHSVSAKLNPTDILILVILSIKALFLLSISSFWPYFVKILFAIYFPISPLTISNLLYDIKYLCKISCLMQFNFKTWKITGNSVSTRIFAYFFLLSIFYPEKILLDECPSFKVKIHVVHLCSK
jgi:hypothetical protein